MDNKERDVKIFRIYEESENQELYEEAARKAFGGQRLDEREHKILIGGLRRLNNVAHRYETESFQDFLTGLPNRKELYRHFSRLEETLKSGKYDESTYMIFMDVNSLKSINDRLGHHEGDRLVKAYGQYLLNSMKQTDTITRIGGDEFAGILYGVHPPTADLESRFESVARNAPSAVRVYDPEGITALSIGIAQLTGSITPEDAMRRADHAMYQAKFQSKVLGANNHVVIWSPEVSRNYADMKKEIDRLRV